METNSKTKNCPIRWLEDEFIRRKIGKQQYSLRQFAKKIGVPAGRLSELFSGQRNLSLGLAERIVSNLELAKDEREEFLKTVISQRLRQVEIKHTARAETIIPDEALKVIADWYHFAILSLVRTYDFDPRPVLVARRLGISVVEVRQAFKRLEGLGLIRKEGESWARTSKNLSTSWDIPSEALKKTHAQELERAIVALQAVPLEKRDVSAFTMPTNISQLPKAKRLIREFQASMEGILETGPKTEVYTLNIQLLPVTKGAKL